MEISEHNRGRLDQAMNKALEHNMVTVFIHNDHPGNLWPDGMFAAGELPGCKREPDLNILHYDYNNLLLSTYKRYHSGAALRSGYEISYFSISSTAPVTAGFVALLKSLNNTLPPQAYKEILQSTSYPMQFTDPFTQQPSACQHVADIQKAVMKLQQMKAH